jgi:WD40 repeat protein
MAVVFDVKSGELSESLDCPKQDPHDSCLGGQDVDFRGDGKRIVIGTTDDVLYVWDIERGSVKTVKRTGGRWWAVRFSPDGRFIAAGGAGGTVLIWDVDADKEYCDLTGHVGSVYAIEFSENGDLLATGGMDQTVRIWEAKDHAAKDWGLGRELTINRSGK